MHFGTLCRQKWYSINRSRRPEPVQCHPERKPLSDPDHQPIGQTGDGEQGGADKSLMHADLIRTIGRDDGNAARTDTDSIRGTGIPGDLKGIFGGHCIQTDGLK